uniref:Uncharacterized protein n=1 Tax=Arion vulgaris TaxID=1028688 RepID=A0A0B7B0V4_9EUPU
MLLSSLASLSQETKGFCITFVLRRIMFIAVMAYSGVILLATVSAGKTGD